MSKNSQLFALIALFSLISQIQSRCSACQSGGINCHCGPCQFHTNGFFTQGCSGIRGKVYGKTCGTNHKNTCKKENYFDKECGNGYQKKSGSSRKITRRHDNQSCLCKNEIKSISGGGVPGPCTTCSKIGGARTGGTGPSTQTHKLCTAQKNQGCSSVEVANKADQSCYNFKRVKGKCGTAVTNEGTASKFKKGFHAGFAGKNKFASQKYGTCDGCTHPVYAWSPIASNSGFVHP